jgi:hypothetical protein
MLALSNESTQSTESPECQVHDQSSNHGRLTRGQESLPKPPCRAYIPHRPTCPADDSRATFLVRAQRRKKKARLRYSLACNSIPLQDRTNEDSDYNIPDQTQSHCEESINTTSATDSVDQPKNDVSALHDRCVVGSKASWIWVNSSNVVRGLWHASNDPLPLHISAHNSSLASSNQDGVSRNVDRAEQCLFICLEQGPFDQYAITIPCLRPNNVPFHPWETGCEWNSDILQRMLDECFRHIGSWKRFLPFFGITEHKIVEVGDYCLHERLNVY